MSLFQLTLMERKDSQDRRLKIKSIAGRHVQSSRWNTTLIACISTTSRSKLSLDVHTFSIFNATSSSPTSRFYSLRLPEEKKKKYRITTCVIIKPKQSSNKREHPQWSWQSSGSCNVARTVPDGAAPRNTSRFPSFLIFLPFSFFLNCIYWLEAIESNWMKQPVIYERLSGANYLSIHSVLSLHSFIIHSRPVYGRCMYSSSKGPFNWSVIV